MKRITQIGPLARAIAVISAVAVVTTGVTFAALQSQNATLSGNTIKSATASLQIGDSASNVAASYAGFTFANVEPGGAATPAGGNLFYLKNSGSTDLNLKLAVNKGQFTASNALDLSKVSIILTPVSGGSAVTLPLATLISGSDSGGTTLGLSLPAGTAGQYKLQVAMAADAVSGGTTTVATIGNLDLIFSGNNA